MANMIQRNMAKQLSIPFATHCTHAFFIENYGCELLNLNGTVWKVELISTFTTAVCECRNVSDKYTWDNDVGLKQLYMDQNCSEDNRSD